MWLCICLGNESNLSNLAIEKLWYNLLVMTKKKKKKQDPEIWLQKAGLAKYEHSNVSVFQSNEVKSSYHMELEGLKRILTVIKNQDVDIQTLVTDRHSGIKKYMHEQEEDIDRRFDCWPQVCV